MPTVSAPVTWNNLRIEYVGPLSLDYALDGVNRNAKVKVTNVGTTAVENIYFQVAIVGLGSYPMPTGDGGFAVFPNGGNIDLAPGESYVAQNWLQGVYEGRFGNIPPNEGQTRTYTFDFILATDNAVFQQANPLSDPAKAGSLTQSISFSRNDSSQASTATQTLSGTVSPSGLNASTLRVEMATLYSSWTRLDVTSGPAGLTFSEQVPQRDDWQVRITADGMASRLFSAGDLAQAGTIALTPADPLTLAYRVSYAADSPTGYWRGIASESERTFVLIPGQENWSDPGDDNADAALRATSVIRKYSFSGDLLWEYAPGWETWGGGMSADGSRVAFLLNPDITRYGAGQWKLGVLDGQTGQLLWQVTGMVPHLEGLEAAVDATGSYVAAGSTQGALGLYNGTTGALIWQKQAGTFGQVRKLVFDGAHLYVGSGDGYVEKLVAATGDTVWQAYVGGWPFVNGLSISADGRYIAVGTKSKDTTVVDAATGAVLWSRETGALDAVFSPDGRYVANFNGDIFDTVTGDVVGMTRVNATAHFSSDSRYLIQADRGLLLISDLTGQVLFRREDDSDTQHSSGEQAQWSHLSDDGRTIIVASRDMSQPGERGLTIWSLNQSNTINGTSASDVIASTEADDSISGAAGIDVVTYRGTRASYDIAGSLQTWTVQDRGGTDGTDTLSAVERLQFTDISIAVDIEERAGTTAKVLGAVFGRESVSNEQYAGIGLYYLDQLGYTYEGLMDLALTARLGPNASHGAVVDLLYTNVVGFPAPPDVQAYYVGLLDRGDVSRAGLGVLAAETDQNRTSINLAGLANTGLEYLPFAP